MYAKFNLDESAMASKGYKLSDSYCNHGSVVKAWRIHVYHFVIIIIIIIIIIMNYYELN
jgi:hypothetical protein